MKRQRVKIKKSEIEEIAEEIEKEAFAAPKEKVSLRFDRVISTGSTLVDLSISGSRIRGGGIPGGALVEIFGRSGSGKTSLLMELVSSAQHHGGDARVRDPESRLDQEYSEIYGVSIHSKNFDYARPNTVEELFDDLYTWTDLPDAINIFAADSIAALSTDMEMEQGDKRGQRQALEFSKNLRRCARKIGEKDRVVVFTNQVREGEFGEKTPCGRAMEFYGSLRLQITQQKKIMVEKKTPYGTTEERAWGIESKTYVRKSSMDDPYREAPVFIKFGYGVDDIRGNLQWIKDRKKDTMYDCITKKYQRLDSAVRYIEENDFQRDLRERTIDLWLEIESLFKEERKPKVRF